MAKMDRKSMLLLIAVVAVGLFVLPSTLALYSGQHMFVNGTNVKCEKCHGTGGGDQISDEIALSNLTDYAQTDINATTTAGKVIHSSYSCRGCHGLSGGLKQGVDGRGSGNTTHFGLRVDCISCHLEMNTTGGEFTNDAHRPFVNYSETNRTQGKEDVACISCHTSVAVSATIAWNMNTSVYFINATQISGTAWNINTTYVNATWV